MVISPRVICALLHFETVSPRLEFVQTRFCTKEISWNIVIRPVLNWPDDNEGKRVENKTLANISLYTLFHWMILTCTCLLARSMF